VSHQNHSEDGHGTRRHWLEFMIVPSKFQFPSVPVGYVKRPRLDMKLQSICRRRLTWIVAPPGSGKTTLVSGWMKQAAHPVATIVLDEADNHLLRFWLHVIAAIHHAFPDMEDDLTNRFIELYMQQPGRALTDLNEACSRLSQPIVIVLDDYHVIHMPDIHDMLSAWIRTMPDHVHLVILSRTEAPLDVSKRSVNRLGWHDLAFTEAETRRFFRQTETGPLSADQLRYWQQQTEGWALGMRMLEATIRGGETAERTELDESGLAGDRQALTGERLMGMLLDQLPEETIRFLLRTSLPERIQAPLCSELTGHPAPEQMFAFLGKETVFFHRLQDGDRIWYRYHPLIAQMLRNRLLREDPVMWQSLQWKTGRWLENNGYPMEAMEHYMAGSHYEDAGRLLERLFNQFILTEAWALRRFFEMIPEEMIQRRPKLYVSYLFFIVPEQPANRSFAQLEAIERQLTLQPGELPLEGRDYLLRVIVVMRAYVCMFQHDFDGLASYLELYLERGYPAHDEIFAYIDYSVHHYSRLRSFPGVLGRLREAQRCFEPVARRWRDVRSYNAAYYAIGYAELLYEWNRLRDAKTYVTLARTVGDELQAAALFVPAAILQGLLAIGCNDRDNARRYVSEVRSRLNAKETAYWAPVLDAWDSKFQLLSGIDGAAAGEKYIAAHRTSTPHESSVTNTLLCMIVLARAKIAVGAYAEAHMLLKKLQKRCAEQQQLAEQIEVYILHAILYEKQGKHSLAARTLGKALLLSAADGYIRAYVGEGETVRRIVLHYRDLRQSYRLKERHVSLRYVNQILFAFEGQQLMPENADANEDNPLSKKEMQVLLGLSISNTNKEIAASMGISTGTVHTYVQRLFAKLNVNKRKDAVLQAYRKGWLKPQ